MVFLFERLLLYHTRYLPNDKNQWKNVLWGRWLKTDDNLIKETDNQGKRIFIRYLKRRPIMTSTSPLNVDSSRETMSLTMLPRNISFCWEKWRRRNEIAQVNTPINLCRAQGSRPRGRVHRLGPRECPGGHQRGCGRPIIGSFNQQHNNNNKQPHR